MKETDSPQQGSPISLTRENSPQTYYIIFK